MSLSSVGSVDIYAETGDDQWKIIQKRIRHEIESKKLKPGDVKVMRVHFDEPLVIEIKVSEMPQGELW